VEKKRVGWKTCQVEKLEKTLKGWGEENKTGGVCLKKKKIPPGSTKEDFWRGKGVKTTELRVTARPGTWEKSKDESKKNNKKERKTRRGGDEREKRKKVRPGKGGRNGGKCWHRKK